MALFKLRRKADEPAAAAAPAESIEVLRRRARHRLIGAVVLVLAAVIGFPILFDTQPRPVAVDIPIEIPDRNKVKPLEPAPVAAARPQASAPVAAVGQGRPVVQAPRAVEAPAPPPAETRAAAAAPAPAPAAKVESPPESKPEPRTEAKPAAPPEPRVDEAAKARALLEGKAVDETGRFVVQVGAFAEDATARRAQQKLERAGLKNYRQVADTEEGKRIRVRAGPFASRAEADKAAEKIKGLDLPARVLTL